MNAYHILKIKSINTDLLHDLQIYIQSVITDLQYIRVVPG